MKTHTWIFSVNNSLSMKHPWISSAVTVWARERPKLNFDHGREFSQGTVTPPDRMFGNSQFYLLARIPLYTVAKSTQEIVDNRQIHLPNPFQSGASINTSSLKSSCGVKDKNVWILLKLFLTFKRLRNGQYDFLLKGLPALHILGQKQTLITSSHTWFRYSNKISAKACLNINFISKTNFWILSNSFSKC